MTELLLTAVVGQPVLHSRSPQLYQSLLPEKLSLTCLRISTGSPAEILPAADSLRLHGFNITAPFKQAILPYLDTVHPAADKINGVNLVLHQGNRWHGTNTDYAGVQRVFQNHNVLVAGKKVLIAGAGGAARAAALACQNQKAASVTFLNRSEKKARESALQMGCRCAGLKEWPVLAKKSHILISCIPGPYVREVLPGRNFPEIILEADYAHPGLAFLHGQGHCLYLSGIEWLVHQGLPAFRRLTGLKPSGFSLETLQHHLKSESSSSRKKIALIGFMGTGKTAAGKKLACLMKRSFIDTDLEIEAAAGSTIPEIFRIRGEPGFRKLEQDLVPGLIRNSDESVLSLGGGAPLSQNIKNVLRKECLCIWLMTPWKLTQRRLAQWPRPLLAAQKQGDSLKSIFYSRHTHYARIADLVIPMEYLTPETAARRIADEIHSSI